MGGKIHLDLTREETLLTVSCTFQIMDGLDRTMADWLGEEPTARMRANMDVVKSVRFLVATFRKQAHKLHRAMRGSSTTSTRCRVLIQTQRCESCRCYGSATAARPVSRIGDGGWLPCDPKPSPHF